ncbi:RNA methyltransferase [Spirochaetia bacterium]|nr:RNA methyltransferase [Spirochaetia bacterium]
MRLSDVVIVLVRPSEAGNVGAVCRAMMNMGLSRLRVAAPMEIDGKKTAIELSKGLNGSIVRSRAVHAGDVWDRAEFFGCLEDAVADCGLVIGTTRRMGQRRKVHSLTPGETAAYIRAWPGTAGDGNERGDGIAPDGRGLVSRAARQGGGTVALVFGNERTGLEDRELKICNLAAHIPANDAFPSLNLSHAVQIFCYELFLALGPDPASGSGEDGGPTMDVRPAHGGRWVPLDQQRIAELVRSVTFSLESLGFYRQPGREEQEQFLQDVFSRAALTQREAEYMANIFFKAARLGNRQR